MRRWPTRSHQRSAHRVGNLFRSSLEPWVCGPLALSRGGLARESAAVACCGCSGSRTACGPPLLALAGKWLKRGLPCRELHCPPCQVPLTRRGGVHGRRCDDRSRSAQGQRHGSGAGPGDQDGDRGGPVRQQRGWLWAAGGLGPPAGAAPLGGGGLPRRGPAAGAAAGRRRRARAGGARQAGCPGAGVLPGAMAARPAGTTPCRCGWPPWSASRKHPRIPARHGRDARREFEYARHGTISIIAAMNVATGQVIAERIHRNDSAAFTAFLVRRLRAAHMLLHARRVANLELLRKELRRRPRHIQRILQRPARSTNRAQLHREAKAVMVRPAARDQVPAGRRRPGPPGGRRPWPRLLRARPPSRRSAPCRSAPGRPSARRASAAARS